MDIDLRRDFGIVRIELPTPFPVGPVNAYLVLGDQPVLFDTGLNDDDTYDRLSAALADEGLGFEDLRAIVVSHGHRDHMGLLGRLLREFDLDAYGHPLVQKLGAEMDQHPEQRKAFFEGILREFGVPEDIQREANSLYERFRAFSEPFTLSHVYEDEDDVLGYRTVYVPGHSPSDTLFIQSDAGYTFVADHILTNTNPNPLLRRPVGDAPRAKALVEYRASLRRARELDLGVCLPGHGEPFSNHRSVVDGILARHERRMEQVRKLIRAGARSPYEVSKGLFPDLPTPHIHLGLSIAVGHMEVLEEEGELESSHVDGKLVFSPA